MHYSVTHKDLCHLPKVMSYNLAHNFFYYYPVNFF